MEFKLNISPIDVIKKEHILETFILKWIINFIKIAEKNLKN